MWSGFIGLSVQSGMEFKMLQNATICNLRKSLFIKCLSIAVKEQIIYLVFIKKLNKKNINLIFVIVNYIKSQKLPLERVQLWSFTALLYPCKALLH